LAARRRTPGADLAQGLALAPAWAELLLGTAHATLAPSAESIGATLNLG